MFSLVIILCSIFLKLSLLIRLPFSVSPISYDLSINLNDDSFKTSYFSGLVKISFQLTKPERFLYTNNFGLKFEKVELQSSSRSYEMKNFDYNLTTQTEKMEFDEQLPSGQFNLSIFYNGNLSDWYYGFYKDIHVDKNGKTRYSAVTQFEPHHARKAFPCFDEPALKATFTIAVTHPKTHKCFSNNEQDSQKEISTTLMQTTFKPTPKMSTYLVAFIITEDTCSSLNGHVPLRVCSRAETSSDRKYGLGMINQALKFMNQYTGIPYKSLGIEKLDAVVTRQYTGAMENWGLLTYLDYALLWNEKKSTHSQKYYVTRTTVHETIHMWFGNLVTLEWWSYTFLNEGITRYFEILSIEEIDSSWQPDQQFVTNMLTTLQEDSLKKTVSLSSDVDKLDDIKILKFSSVSYNKGCAVMRMISSVVGEKNLQSSLRDYLKKFKFSTATPEDLYASIEKYAYDSINFSTFARSWVDQPGYPIITVSLVGSDIILKQERYLEFNKTDSKTKWHIPITYTTSNNINFKKISPQLWFRPEDTEVKIPNVIKNEKDWILLNNQHIGFYRVRYDDDLWQRIYQILRKTPDTFDPISKVQIVDDLFSSAIDAKISYASLLDNLDFLSEETDYYSWFVAEREFSHILSRLYKKNNRKNFLEYVKNFSSKFCTSALSSATSSDHISVLKLSVAVTLSCLVEDTDYINFAKNNFTIFIKGSDINPNHALPLLCTAIRNGENWNLLWNVYKKSFNENEKLRILQALACSTNQTVLEKFFDNIYLEKLVDRDYSYNFASSIILHPDGVDACRNHMTRNFEKCYNCVQFMKFNAGKLFRTRSQIDQFNDTLNKQKLSSDLQNLKKLVIENALEELPRSEKVEREIQDYFSRGSESNVARATKSYLVFVSLSVIFTVIF